MHIMWFLNVIQSEQKAFESHKCQKYHIFGLFVGFTDGSLIK